MPCMSDGYPSEAEGLSRIVRSMRAKLDHVTALCCEATSLLRGTPAWDKASPRLVEWRYSHDIEDAEREKQRKRDAAKRAALRAKLAKRAEAKASATAKLTHEELEALGLV